MKKEERFLARKPELRESTDPSKPGFYLSGYAAVFNSESEVLWDKDVLADKDGNPLPFVEVLDAGVFDRTLQQRPDVRALHNHETIAVLGRTTSGTLDLVVDRTGLYFDDLLPRNVDGERAQVQVERGDVDGCSFGFNVLKATIVARDGLPHLRTLFDVDLHEVSIAVTFPAYPGTSTALSQRDLGQRGTSPATTPRLDHARRCLRVGHARMLSSLK